MNKKGFTLIELLAVIIIIGILTVLIVPNLLSYVETSREASYNQLLHSIVVAAENYYQECDYGDLSSYTGGVCNVVDSEIAVTLGDLANTGFLSVNDTSPDNENIKVVLDPRNDKDISACGIIITKTISEERDENGITNPKTTYKVTASSNSSDSCPREYPNIE